MNDRTPSRIELEPALARYREAPESKLFAPLAAAYRDSGRPEEAVRILQTGLERHSRYVSALVLLAQCHLDLQNEAEAEAVFGRVLEQDAENLVALRYRAELARRRGALERAVELLRRALEIDPFDREVQADLGLATTALERRVRESHTPPPAAFELPPAATAPAPARAPETPFRPTPPAAPAPTPAPSSEPGRAWPPVPEVPAWSPAPEPQSPWLEPPTTATPLPPEPWGGDAAEPQMPGVPWEPALGGLHEVSPPEPPRIDLRQVGSAAPETAWPRSPEPASPPTEPATPDRSSWTFSRDDDRIVVAPDTPVRGPIRSVEDRLWSERKQGIRPPEPAPDATPEAPAEPEPAPAGEFATLTLARIYESQGYYQKALGIYDELLRRHSGDPEIVARRAALQRRLAGIDEPAAETQAAASDAQPPVAWRLLDPTTLESPAQAAERLRLTTQAARDAERARRHVVVGTPPPTPTAAPVEAPAREDVSRGHPDYERFLAYVRSLRRES